MSDEEKSALKDELKAKLIAAGVEIDHRWGIAKLQSLLGDLAIKDEQVPEETVLVEFEPEIEGDETILEPTRQPDPPLTQPEGTLRCRVTKKGNNKIFTGKEEPKYFEWEEIIFLPPQSARQLEDRSFVEILDEPLD